METYIPIIAALITLLALDAGETGSRMRRVSARRRRTRARLIG